MANHNIIKLEKALNFRDLGGYKSSLGGAVKRGKLYRSDSLANLSQADIDTLLDMNIKTVIDLRTDFEIAQGECRLRNLGGVEYYKISLMDNVHSADFESFRKAMPKSMKELYISLLDNNADKIARVFDTILERSENAVVFNCTAGKDRTGVIAALILDLLGVNRGDIYESYTITETLMETLSQKVRERYEDKTGLVMPRYLFEARRESIEAFTHHLYSKYGGAREYLRTHGFGEKKIDDFVNVYLERD